MRRVGERGAQWVRDRVHTWLPMLVCSAVGVWLLWPVPSGKMPFSGDHPVHLTRIWMWAQALARGDLRGFDATWFLGTPVGDLYPILGDALVVAVRALSLAWLTWPQSYAFAFTLVFLLQAWALLRAAKAFDLGPWAATSAGLFILLDIGTYREGGWIYTVDYGVWPQALATALQWLAFAELSRACIMPPDDRMAVRAVVRTGVTFALAVLAHPMTVLTTVIGVPLFVVTHARRSAPLGRVMTYSVWATGLGLAISAFWLLPMLAHSEWVAAYGWLWRPLSGLVRDAVAGSITQQLAPWVGYASLVGLALAVFDRPGIRFAAVYTVVLWASASFDVVADLRLDLLSTSFEHIQYQRFLAAAKPGVFLLAGYALARVADMFRSTRPSAAARASSMVIALVLTCALAWHALEHGRRHGLGTPQIERRPGQPEFEAHVRALYRWMRTTYAASPAPFRFAYFAPRNEHTLTDAPVFTGAPLYKLGFTPGDNFIHKPETQRPEVLDHAHVTHVIGVGVPGHMGEEVARFGNLVVRRRRSERERGPLAGNAAKPEFDVEHWAHLRGPGQLEFIDDDPTDGDMHVRVHGGTAATSLVFDVPGYPRWQLTRNTEPVPWKEIPVFGAAAAVVPQGLKRGVPPSGKALGDDGREPLLLATEAVDGEYHLEYRSSTARDRLAAAISVLASLLAWVTWVSTRLQARTTQVMATLAKRIDWRVTLAIVIVLVAMAGVRWQRGFEREATRLVGWAGNDSATLIGPLAPSLLKTDMGIHPAMVVARGVAREAIAEIELEAPRSLQGWVAIDDDEAQMRREGTRELHVEVLDDGAWKPVAIVPIRHRPGRNELDLDTRAWAGRPAKIRFRMLSRGRPPRTGFDFQLGAPT